jgi:hypothetical protein
MSKNETLSNDALLAAERAQASGAASGWAAGEKVIFNCWFCRWNDRVTRKCSRLQLYYNEVMLIFNTTALLFINARQSLPTLTARGSKRIATF